MRNYIRTGGASVQPVQRAHTTRLYPIDSAHACARIVALTLICDGQVKRSELDRLVELRGLEQLGLTGAEFQSVVSALCADLLATAKAQGKEDCRIDPRTLEQWMSEVRDAELQRRVLGLCSAVIHADGYVHESESMLMLAAIEHWGIRPEALEAFDPLSSEVDVVLARRRREPVVDRPRRAAL